MKYANLRRNKPRIWLRAVRSVFLDVHAEEAHANAIYLFERKDRLGSVRKAIGYFFSVSDFHGWLHFYRFLRTGKNPDCDLTSPTTIFLEEGIHSVLQVCAKFCLR